MRKYKLIVGFIIALLLLPSAYATYPSTTSDVVITKHIHVESSNGTIPLNLSNPDEIKKYSPAQNLWDKNLTGGGKIIDGILPFDIADLNNTTWINLISNFSLSSKEIASGAFGFYLRLPMSFEINGESHIKLKIFQNGIEEYNTTHPFIFTEADPNTLETVSKLWPFAETKIINNTYNYLGHDFKIWYVHVNTFILPNCTYTIQVNLTNIQNITLFIYNYDYLQDNYTSFHINANGINEDVDGDLAYGIEVQNFVFSSISSYYQSYVSWTSTQPPNPTYVPYFEYFPYGDISGYTGSQYISFAFEIYAFQSTHVEVHFKTATHSNYTSFDVDQGMNTIRGYVKLNFTDNGNYFEEYFMTNHSVSYFLFPSDNTYFQLSLSPYYDYTFQFYGKLYQDIAIHSEEYYSAGSIVLPGDFIQSMSLAIKYAPSSELPLVLFDAYGLTIGRTILDIFMWGSVFIVNALDWAWMKFGDIIKWLYSQSIIKWIVDTIVKVIIPAIIYYGTGVLQTLYLLISLFIYVLGVSFTKRFRDGLIKLPFEGIKGLEDEWEGIVTVVESIVSKIMGVIKK